MAQEKASSKGQAWFCTTGLPSDIVIEVGEMSFHLHKFPLMSKSKKLDLIILDQNPTSIEPKNETESEIQEEGDKKSESENEIQEVDLRRISLPGFPGGTETFEITAKFCYGVKIEMTPFNSIPLHCAAHYLEMSEEFSSENLISRTERYLTQSVFRNLKDSVKALKSCEGEILNFAEELGLVQKCIDAIATRANSSDLSSLFGWPITDKGSSTPSIRRKNYNKSDTWIEELAELSLPIYTRVISAMKIKDVNNDLIEGSLISYAKKSIPGLSRSRRYNNITKNVPSEEDQRELLETIVSSLPIEKSSSNGGNTSTAKFLFGLLRTGSILAISEDSRSSLERKIASQMENAQVDDLLIPSYSCLVETLYDVDCVERILKWFLEGLEGNGDDNGEGNGEVVERKLARVGKLMDGYLGEIATDGNLTPERFAELALALPEQARVVDDGLYRAVDIYLKAHPGIKDDEKERVTGIMDYQKLTLEACTHAAQNERLPLRAVVQVLFFEQLQLRRAITRTIMATDADAEGAAGLSEGEHRIEGQNWRVAFRGNQLLRLDMDSMRSRVHDLEKECLDMRKTIEKIDRKGEVLGEGKKGLNASKRFGCKFRTQVCDSQERTVIAPPRRPRINQSP